MKKIIIVLIISLFLSACNNKVSENIIPISSENSSNSEKTVNNVPNLQEQEKDIIRNFFALIDENKPSEAVMMMSEIITKDDNQKQAWAVQFNAISLIKALSLEAYLPEEWTDSEHSYKVTLEVKMNPDSASAPIPYYGWDNGQNHRWITVTKENNFWKIKSIATGP